MKPLHLRLIIAKVATDYFAIMTSFILAYFIRVGFIFSNDFPFGEYILPAVYTAPFWLLVMHYARGYKIELRAVSYRHFQRIVFVSLVGTAFFLVSFFFQQKVLFSRLIILLIASLSIVLLFISHYFHDRLARFFYARGKGTYPTLVIGTSREAQKLIKHLKKSRSVHQPVAILDGYGTKLEEIAQVPVLGKLNILEEIIQKYNIEEVLQTDNLEQTINIVNFATQNKLKYAMLPTLLGVYNHASKVEELDGLPVVRVE